MAGVAAGTVIGSIPGLTATMAVAVLVPITFSMQPDSALILMGAIYTGAIYGGAYAAILLNTPGTPSAIATTFDGYPMAKRGDGDLAISVACLSSVIGGLVGALSLLLFAPPLADAALAFGPVEYFWLAVFGLSLIAALSTEDFLKGMIAACFGLLLSMIGISETSAEVRFTFGSNTLLGGIETVSALIGLYCIPVLMDLVAVPDRHLEAPKRSQGFRLIESLKQLLCNKVNLFRSSIIGTMVGALPGAGGSIAGLVAYSEARRSCNGEPVYGKGNPGGIIATESANNATVGGGFIPTLVLGIPGTPPDAVILGALLVQGVRTGPTLFSDGASIIYTFMYGLLLATILMLPVGLVIGRFAYRAIARAPKTALIPIVAFMTVIGTFAIRNNIFDIAIMIILGVIGWIASKRGFSVSPIVLGLILGRIAEQGFVQSWTIGEALDDLWGQFFGRPLSIIIIFMTIISLIYPFLPQIRKLFRKDKKLNIRHQKKITQKMKIYDFIAFIIFVFIGIWVLFESSSLNSEAAVFPRAIALSMLLITILAMGRLLVAGHATGEKWDGSFVRRASIPIIMLLVPPIMSTLGFALSGLMMSLCLIFPSYHGRLSLRPILILVITVAAITLSFTFCFTFLLHVPLPTGTFF